MAEDQQRWEVEWYVTETGNVPLRDFVGSLEDDYRDEAFALLEMLEKWGDRLRMPRSKPLGGGLFELRGNVKKQKAIPQRVLDRVRKYQADIKKREKKQLKEGAGG